MYVDRSDGNGVILTWYSSDMIMKGINNILLLGNFPNIYAVIGDCYYLFGRLETRKKP